MMRYEGVSVLIAGGTGFIGSVVVEDLLKEGASVTCLTRQKLVSKQKNLSYLTLDLGRTYEADRTRAEQLTIPFDFLLYLAASIPLATGVKEDMVTAYHNNLTPFLNFLHVFGALSNRIVFTSTADVYGIPDADDFTEDYRVRPVTNYAIAKYCSEHYLEYFSRVHNKQFNILRFAQVYGPNEPVVRAIPIVVQALASGSEFVLKGSGEDLRRFLYVRDASSAVRCAMSSMKNSVFNIAGGEDVSVKEVLAVVEELSGEELNLRHEPNEGKRVNILPNFDRARTQLGFEPRYTFREGIKEVLEGAGL